MTKTKTLNQDGSTLKLVQFTDPHLFADPRGEMRGVNTHDSLSKVLAAARKRHWPPDALLVTGDISQDESRVGYRNFRSLFEPLSLPVLCIPGNHDNPRFMQEELDGDFTVLRPVAFASWTVLLLNTYVHGTASGELSNADLNAAAVLLSENPQTHFLICLHHQPVPVGSRWLDSVGLREPEKFLALTDKYENVRGVLWGHVHQEFDDLRNGVRMMGSPSTCRQFKPGSSDFALDDQAPGYRWLNLAKDGSIETGVEYVHE